MPAVAAGIVTGKSIYNVLFLCTGNSARSILAEKLLQHLGPGRFNAYSAGSRPAGRVSPFALEILRRHGISTAGLRSKSWDEFSGPDAPQMDFIFTVCDNAAAETCPVWPGHPATAHWGISDPAQAGGSDQDRMKAFEIAYASMERRIRQFLTLDPERPDIKDELAAIGAMTDSNP